MPAGRLVLLVTSHRVAPGQLTWPAWQALRSAAHVVTADPEHPQRPYVEAAGIVVDDIDAAAAAAPATLAARLVGVAADGDVVYLGSPDGDPGLGDALAQRLARLADQGAAPEVEVLAGSYDLPGALMLDLVAVMDRLRSPGGCPWDREQTHASLVRYLLEEAYETVEMVETGDRAGLREELGDLLLQVVFHARIAEEHPDEPWSVDDVAAGIVEKLVHRHPHVFGTGSAATAADVEANWETIKLAEKGRGSAVDGVPLAQPALALAAKLLARAERLTVPVDLPAPAVEVPTDADALGELLLGVVAAARARGVDAEAALREAARRFAARVRAAEAGAQR